MYPSRFKICVFLFLVQTDDELDWGTDSDGDESGQVNGFCGQTTANSNRTSPAPAPSVDTPSSPKRLSAPFANVSDKDAGIADTGDGHKSEAESEQKVMDDEIMSESPRFCIGDWVVLVNETNVYLQGLIGVVVPRVGRLGDPGLFYHTIAAPSRTSKTVEAEQTSQGETRLIPPPSLLFYEEAVEIASRPSPFPFDGSNEVVLGADCAHPGCPCGKDRHPSYSCPHLKEFFWRDNIFQHGLCLYTCTANSLEHAPVTVGLHLFRLLGQSQHPRVLASWYQIPLPSCWSFTSGELVKVAEPKGLSEFASPTLANFMHCLGTIQCSQGQTCWVRFDQGTFSIPTPALVKVFGLHTGKVDIPSFGGTGRVLAVEDETVVVTVDSPTEMWLDSEECSREEILIDQLQSCVFRLSLNAIAIPPTPTAAIPAITVTAPLNCLPQRRKPSRWIGLRVIVVGSRSKHGYQGTVRDVQVNINCVSGLRVQVDYDVVNATPPVEWLDYSDVRRDEWVLSSFYMCRSN